MNVSPTESCQSDLCAHWSHREYCVPINECSRNLASMSAHLHGRFAPYYAIAFQHDVLYVRFGVSQSTRTWHRAFASKTSPCAWRKSFSKSKLRPNSFRHAAMAREWGFLAGSPGPQRDPAHFRGVRTPFSQHRYQLFMPSNFCVHHLVASNHGYSEYSWHGRIGL